MKKVVLTILVLTCGGAVSLLIGARRAAAPGASETASAEGRHRPAGDSDELQALERKVRNVERATAALALDRAAAVAVPQRPRPPTTPEEIEVVRQRVREEEKRHFDRLEDLFRAETVDHGWTSEFTQRVKTALSADSFAPLRLAELACTSTMCRAEFGSEDSQGDLLVPQLFSKIQGISAGIIRPKDGAKPGQRTGVAFLAREGHELPAPERMP
jgi:hypothetical protein